MAGESILNEFMGFKIYSHTGLTGYFEAVIGLVSLKELINIYRRNNRKSMNQIRDGLNFYISWNQTAENFVLQVKRSRCKYRFRGGKRFIRQNLKRFLSSIRIIFCTSSIERDGSNFTGYPSRIFFNRG